MVVMEQKDHNINQLQMPQSCEWIPLNDNVHVRLILPDCKPRAQVLRTSGARCVDIGGDHESDNDECL